MQVTLLKLPLWETGSSSEDTRLWITLPRTTQEASLEAVSLQSSTPVSSPHSVTECPSEVVTGPSLTEEIADLLSNPMFEMPGEPSTCNSPYSMAKKEGNPPDPGDVIQGYLKQPPPPPMGLHRWIWLTPQPIPAAPSHIVLWRGTPALLLSHHQPTLSTCQMMYCTFKRK